jgi:hypothetical protein
MQLGNLDSDESRHWHSGKIWENHMADAVRKTTLVPSYSVHTPDYPTATYLINPAGLPALDAAPYVPIKYRKLITGDTDVGEMTQGEKDAYDAANPLIIQPQGNGAWADLGRTTVSSPQASIDIEGESFWWDGTYAAIKIAYNGLKVDTNGAVLFALLKIAGSYRETAHYARTDAMHHDGGHVDSNFGLNGNIRLHPGAMGTAQSDSCEGEITIWNPGSIGDRKRVGFETSMRTNVPQECAMARGGSEYVGTAADPITDEIEGLRLDTTGANIDKITYRVEGLKA